MKTPVLCTSRIILRPLTVSDAEEVFRNWTSDSEVARYMNWNLHQSVSDSMAWLKLEEEHLISDKIYTWGLQFKQSGELFGSAGIKYNEDYQLFEIGYNIMKKYWNSGFTTEAGQAIVEFAHKQLGISALLGRHAIPNLASGKVLQKLGFVFLGKGSCTSLDGKRTFDTLNYIWQVPKTA